MNDVHVLVLTRDFAPTDSPIARRALAIANAVAQAPGSVTVLSVDSPSVRNDHGELPRLGEAIDPRVRVVRVADDHPDLVQDIAAWPRERAADPAGWRAAWLAQAAEGFNEPGAGHLLDPVLSRAAAVHAESPVDLVVAVAAPVVLAAAGAELGRDWGCDLVVDLARVSPADLHVEADRVGAALQQASVVTLPDEATRARLDAEVAHQAIVVPDGGEVVLRENPAAVRHGRPERIGCFVEADAWGSFVEVLEGWFETQDREPDLAGATFTVHGRFPTAGGAAFRMAAAQAAEDHGVVLDTPEPREVLHVDPDPDLIVVVSRGDLPAGRTLDHLVAGRPVVWCTAQEPSTDHPYERAAHVVRAASLSPADVRAAIVAASAIDTASIEIHATASSWPAVVPTLLVPRTDGSPT